MLGSVLNALVLGLFLIGGMNACIPDLADLLGATSETVEAYTVLWLRTVGLKGTVLFQILTLVAIECSNCANLTSASRMVYAFSRDGGLPGSRLWHHLHHRLQSPVRSIWLVVAVSFLVAVPSLGSTTVLSALFSLTATGLYSSYFIPVFLRLTVGRSTFVQQDWHLGRWSVPFAAVSCLWCAFMTIVLCLPEQTPVSDPKTINYSPIMLGAVVVFAIISWVLHARHWFTGPRSNLDAKVCEEDGGQQSSRKPSLEDSAYQTECCCKEPV